MSAPKDGGAAFPTLDDPGNGMGLALREHGMSLRDYFAASAVSGLIGLDGLKPEHLAPAATWAYRFADAMLAERVKVQP